MYDYTCEGTKRNVRNVNRIKEKDKNEKEKDTTSELSLVISSDNDYYRKHNSGT